MTDVIEAALIGGALFLGAGLLAWLPSLPPIRDLVVMPWDEDE